MKTMYAVIEADFNRRTGEENGDSQVTWYESLEKANRKAAYLWNAMSEYDRKKTTVYVLDCRPDDFEDPADTDTWNWSGGYMDRELRFNSENPFSGYERAVRGYWGSFSEISFKCHHGDSEYNSFTGILFGNDECFDGDSFYQWLIDENRNLYKVYYNIPEGTALDCLNYNEPNSIYFQNEIVG